LVGHRYQVIIHVRDDIHAFSNGMLFCIVRHCGYSQVGRKMPWGSSGALYIIIGPPLRHQHHNGISRRQASSISINHSVPPKGARPSNISGLVRL
jgi:hypothetical protein